MPGRNVIAPMAALFAARQQEKKMSGDMKRDNALDRRTVLRAGAAAAFAAPLGVFGAQAFPFRAAVPKIDFSEFPICKPRRMRRR